MRPVLIEFRRGEGYTVQPEYESADGRIVHVTNPHEMEEHSVYAGEVCWDVVEAAEDLPVYLSEQDFFWLPEDAEPIVIDEAMEERIQRKLELGTDNLIPGLPLDYQPLAREHGMKVILWQREGLTLEQVQERLSAEAAAEEGEAESG